MIRKETLPQEISPTWLLELATRDAVRQKQTDILESLYREMMLDPSKKRHLVYIGEMSTGLRAELARALREDGFDVLAGPDQTGYPKDSHWLIGGWTKECETGTYPDSRHGFR